MNTIVLLCGANKSGKTTTLRRFFINCKERKVNRATLYERAIDGKKVYAVGFDSPQEREKFCRVDLVKANIEKRITICEEAARGQNYVLVIPFGLRENKERTQLNKRCILEPIEWLKGRGFRVFSIYLKKANTRRLEEKNAVMVKITQTIFLTTPRDCDKSGELEKFIIALP
jgi:hypothetical protein